MRTYPAPDAHGPWLVLAHGAGAGQDHPWIQGVASRLAGHGITVVTFDFPYIAAGRKLPDPGPVLEQAFEEVWEAVWRTDAARPDGPPRRIFAGGKSMGGRMASQVAARAGFRPPPVGLVFFGYPLHPPRRPSDRRDRHLPAVAHPMLFLHGTRDPFGSPDEMQVLAAGLPQATLALIDGGDHSLALSKRPDPTGASFDRAIAIAAEWIHRAAGAPGTHDMIA